MTKQELKKAIKLAFKNGMGEKIRAIHVDLDTPFDAVIDVGVVYGRYGIDTVEFSLQKLSSNKDDFYSIYQIQGKTNIYHIKNINKELKELV